MITKMPSALLWTKKLSTRFFISIKNNFIHLEVVNILFLPDAKFSLKKKVLKRESGKCNFQIWDKYKMECLMKLGIKCRPCQNTLHIYMLVILKKAYKKPYVYIMYITINYENQNYENPLKLQKTVITSKIFER
jgi:hypothetical protein